MACEIKDQTGLEAAKQAFSSCATSKPNEGDLLRLIGSLLSTGLIIPMHDEQVFTYFGSTENIETITYKLNSLSVGVSEFTYDGDGGTTSTDRVINHKFIKA